MFPEVFKTDTKTNNESDKVKAEDGVEPQTEASKPSGKPGGGKAKKEKPSKTPYDKSAKEGKEKAKGVVACINHGSEWNWPSIVAGLGSQIDERIQKQEQMVKKQQAELKKQMDGLSKQQAKLEELYKALK